MPNKNRFCKVFDLEHGQVCILRFENKINIVTMIDSTPVQSIRYCASKEAAKAFFDSFMELDALTEIDINQKLVKENE